MSARFAAVADKTGSCSALAAVLEDVTVTGWTEYAFLYAASVAAITKRTRCPFANLCTMPGSVTSTGFIASATRTGATRRCTRSMLPSGATS